MSLEHRAAEAIKIRWAGVNRTDDLYDAFAAAVLSEPLIAKLLRIAAKDIADAQYQIECQGDPDWWRLNYGLSPDEIAATLELLR